MLPPLLEFPARQGEAERKQVALELPLRDEKRGKRLSPDAPEAGRSRSRAHGSSTARPGCVANRTARRGPGPGLTKAEPRSLKPDGTGITPRSQAGLLNPPGSGSRELASRVYACVRTATPLIPRYGYRDSGGAA
jgi:hypothetical protein